MDLVKLGKRVAAGETIFLCDDFEEACVRVYIKENKTHTYFKKSGRVEIEVPFSNEIIFEMLLGGREITEEEYRKY